MAAKPGEHKTVQARILAYAQEIGWTYVPRGRAEKRRGFDHSKATPADRAAEASPYFDDLLDAQVRKLNPKYAEGPGALVGDLRRLHADIAGNRDFLAYLRNTRTFYDKGEGRELNLVLIDSPPRTRPSRWASIRSAATTPRRQSCSSRKWSSPRPRRSAFPTA